MINFGKTFLLGFYRIFGLLRLAFTRDYIKYAKKLGVKIGNNSKLIVHPYFWSLPDFGSEPYLISIGDHTEISFGCTFLTHDGSNWVFRDNEKYKDVIIGGPIRIGNNSFIGCNTTILPGVSIGDNCIIGAGSLITKNVPAGELWGGYQHVLFQQQKPLLINL